MKLDGPNSAILDTNSNESLLLPATGSAVNEVTITNAATGAGPTVGATGGDTNIPLTVKGKGTGNLILGQATAGGIQLVADQPLLDSSGNEFLKWVKTASAVNEITITNGATGSRVVISATGGDAAIGVEIAAKGAGINKITGDVLCSAGVEIDGALDHDGTTVGFYGIAPTTRPSAYTQTYATAEKTHAALTSADLTGIGSSTTGSALAEPSAAYVQAEQQQNMRRIQDNFVLLRADLVDLKQLVNAMLDDFQLQGLLQ